MPAIQSLRTHLVDELIDLLDAENQLIRALPKLATTATSKPLRRAFQNHLKETKTHIARLNEALRALGETPRSKTCAGMQGLLDEGQTVTGKTPAGALRDAVMITSAQKVEHYEMASYGTARTYASVLGETEVARLLAQTLREEKAADRTLTQIAQGAVNDKAADEWQEVQGTWERTAEWTGEAAGYASRQLEKGWRRAAETFGVAQDRSATGKNARSRTAARGPRGATRRAGKKR